MAEKIQQQSEHERQQYIRENQKNIITLALELLHELPKVVRTGDNLYMYNGKFYDLLEDQQITEAFNDFVMKYGITGQWKPATIKAIILFIRTYRKVEKVEMNEKPNLICLNNGVLDTTLMAFYEHSPTYYFDTYIDVDYDPKATECPNFVKYVNHIFNYDEDTVANIIRLGGYLLDYDVDNMKKCNKMFFFDGPGGSGKSTLLETFMMFFSEQQISALSLEDIGSSGMEKDEMITSRVNFTTEQKRSVVEAEPLKTAISGEKTKIKRKYLSSITIRPKMKILVACNGLPKFTDTTDGIYRRLVIFTFNNIYKPKPDHDKIKDAEAQGIFVQDRDLLSKIRSEKQAILNLFLGGLKDLREKNFLFIDSDRSAASIKDFKRMNDTAREFLESHYEYDINSQTPIKNILIEFRSWHRDNVSEGGGFKFRSAELAKRIRDIFTINTNGRYRHETLPGKYEYSNTFPLKEKTHDEEFEATNTRSVSDTTGASNNDEATVSTQQAETTQGTQTEIPDFST